MKCIYCGKETENIIHGECVCLSCVNKLYVPCANCGELHGKGKMTCTDIGYVCSECLEGDFTCCNDCGAWIHNDNIRMVRNRYDCEAFVCDDCCSNNYSYCLTCEEYSHYSIGTDNTFDGQWRCYSCLDDGFVFCHNCNTYYRENVMKYCEALDEWLCPNCYDEKIIEKKTYALNPKYENVKSYYRKALVIERSDNSISLKSYDTEVCTIAAGKIWIEDTYSSTTLRHIKEFLRQHVAEIGEEYGELIKKNFKKKELEKLFKY